MMYNVYYLFSVKDKYFTDLTDVLCQKKIFNSFCGLAYARNSTLKNPIYTHVSYISDIIKKSGEVDYKFLEQLELTYSINISEMLHTDRHLSAFDKKRRLFIAQEIIKLFMQDMNMYKINLVLPEGVDDFVSFFAARYCTHHKIKFFYPVEVGYASRACISSTIYPEPDEFKKKFDVIIKSKQEGTIDFSEVQKEIASYVNSKKKPRYYMGVNEADFRILNLKDLRIFFEYIFAYFRDRHSLPHDKRPLLLPFHRLLKIMRKFNYKSLIKKTAVDSASLHKLSYLIYPLHFEPEASTLIQGRWFNDQRKIIEMLSKSLPVNTVLLVKEHRISIGRRPLSFYKEIIKYHNVFLVDDTIDTYSFINQSKGVVLISSTMGLEALMLGKPVMAFGERFFNASNNVYMVENYREIKNLVTLMLNHRFDHEDLLSLLYTLLANTQYLGNTCHITYKSEDVDILAQAIEEKVAVG